MLTEDVRFLRSRTASVCLRQERRVVAAFADAIARIRPDAAARFDKPLTMLLFGMINWMFTWLKPDGALTMSRWRRSCADLFLGGIGAVKPPKRRGTRASAAVSAGPGHEGDARMTAVLQSLIAGRWIGTETSQALRSAVNGSPSRTRTPRASTSAEALDHARTVGVPVAAGSSTSSSAPPR